MGGVGVNLVGLACGTAGDEFSDKGGHARPPVVLLEKGNGVEVSAVGPGKRFMDALDEGVSGRFGNVEAALVIKSALVEIPVLSGGSR